MLLAGGGNLVAALHKTHFVFQGNSAPWWGAGPQHMLRTSVLPFWRLHKGGQKRDWEKWWGSGPGFHSQFYSNNLGASPVDHLAKVAIISRVRSEEICLQSVFI